MLWGVGKRAMAYLLVGLLVSVTLPAPVQAAAPGEPSNLMPGTIASSSATGTTGPTISSLTPTLSWDTPSGTVTKYRVYYRVAPYTGTTTQIDVTSTSYTTPTLSCGNSYRWQVEAWNGGTVGPTAPNNNADRMYFTTPSCGGGTPGEPSNLMPGTIASSSATSTAGPTINSLAATLSWAAPSSGAESYKYYYNKKTNGAYSSSNTVSGTTTSTSYTTPNLECGSNYRWQVEAILDGQTGPTAPNNNADRAYFTTPDCGVVSGGQPSIEIRNPLVESATYGGFLVLNVEVANTGNAPANPGSYAFSWTLHESHGQNGIGASSPVSFAFTLAMAMQAQQGLPIEDSLPLAAYSDVAYVNVDGSIAAGESRLLPVKIPIPEASSIALDTSGASLLQPAYEANMLTILPAPGSSAIVHEAYADVGWSDRGFVKVVGSIAINCLREYSHDFVRTLAVTLPMTPNMRVLMDLAIDEAAYQGREVSGMAPAAGFESLETKLQGLNSNELEGIVTDLTAATLLHAITGHALTIDDVKWAADEVAFGVGSLLEDIGSGQYDLREIVSRYFVRFLDSCVGWVIGEVGTWAIDTFIVYAQIMAQLPASAYADLNLPNPFGFTFGIQSPMDIRIVDQEGRESGIRNGAVTKEIPGSIVLLAGDHKVVWSPSPAERYDLQGTGTGPTHLTVVAEKAHEWTLDTTPDTRAHAQASDISIGSLILIQGTGVPQPVPGLVAAPPTVNTPEADSASLAAQEAVAVAEPEPPAGDGNSIPALGLAWVVLAVILLSGLATYRRLKP